MKKNIIIVLAVIVAAIFLRFAWSKYDNIMQQKESKKPAPSVTVEEVQGADVIRTFEEPGRVVSQYRVDVLARISGYLQKSYFKEGDFVRQGQTLFLIEPTEYSNAASVAKADVEDIKAKLAYSEKQLQRASELVKQDYIAKSRYDSILSERDSLKAQLASAQSRYNDSNRNLSYTMVKAPVDGLIGIINVTVGNYVTPSSGALTTINSTNPIYVTFPLDSADYSKLIEADKDDNKPRKVELYFADGGKYSKDGVQDFHDNKIDPTTGTVTMRATFENPNKELLHGQFVTAKLYSNNAIKTPVVPQVAVLENQAGKFVYKIDEKGLPQLVYVKVDGQQGDNWIIKEGVNIGDKIITDGLQKVIPGKSVKVLTKDEMEKLKKSEPKEETSEEEEK